MDIRITGDSALLSAKNQKRETDQQACDTGYKGIKSTS